MVVTITPGEGIGAVLFNLGRDSALLEGIRGAELRLTKSEATSLATLIHAVQESKSALPALEDFVQNFPRRI